MADKQPQLYTLDVPQREGKEGYIGTVFGLYLKMGQIICDSDFRETDPRIYFMTKFLINLVPGEDNRHRIKTSLAEEVSKIPKETKNEERIRMRNEICLDHIGVVHDFIDKHVGVSKENRIGFVGVEP